MGSPILPLKHRPGPSYTVPCSDKVPLVSPSTFFSEVTEWLHAQVQLLLSPLVSFQHTAPVPTLPDGCTPTVLGMHLAQSYAHSGIFPLSSGLPTHVAPLLELSFTVHPLADGFPVGVLQDSWSWRDLFTGDPLLVPLE